MPDCNSSVDTTVFNQTCVCKPDHLANTTDLVVALQQPGREQWKERVGQQRQEAFATADNTILRIIDWHMADRVTLVSRMHAYNLLPAACKDRTGSRT